LIHLELSSYRPLLSLTKVHAHVASVLIVFAGDNVFRVRAYAPPNPAHMMPVIARRELLAGYQFISYLVGGNDATSAPPSHPYAAIAVAGYAAGP